IARARFHDAVEQLQHDELLTGDGDVGAAFLLGTKAEEIPGLINSLGAAGQDEGPLFAELVSIDNHLIGTGAVNLHAGDEKHLRNLPVKACLAGFEIAIPLPQDNARLVK